MLDAGLDVSLEQIEDFFVPSFIVTFTQLNPWSLNIELFQT